jgi:hypothetical protein
MLRLFLLFRLRIKDWLFVIFNGNLKRKQKMEMAEVVSLAHFSDTRFGAISRKQVLKIPLSIAIEFETAGLVKITSDRPSMTALIIAPKAQPQESGPEPQSVSLPAAPVSPEPMQKLPRKGRPKKAGEYSR